MRYIDANLLKRELWEQRVENGLLSFFDMIEIIDEQPTADVVEVVRCEECKHSLNCSKNIAMYGKGRSMYEDITFCSYGERRKNEQIH